MAIEHASVQVVRKPWGVTDLRPWSDIDVSGGAVGELWFHRPDQTAPVSALLLKLLFTSEPLSIQVHPDDAFARSIGLPNGKTEAWYILSALPDARVARRIETASQSGRIARVDQGRLDRRSRSMAAGHRKAMLSLCPPARSTPSARASCLPKSSSAATRHSVCSITAGSANCMRTTPWRFPMPGPVQVQSSSRRLSTERMLLIANPHFVLERIDLSANTSWALNTDRETWFLVLDGHAAIGLAAASVGEAIFMGDDRASIEVGADGFSG